ncbi:hypothetical protein, partial [Escherichia coli]|uniref:hypothetical protein n=1 Tax=Escherichia coli TaxID=562 RepID=UPI001BFED02B
ADNGEAVLRALAEPAGITPAKLECRQAQPRPSRGGSNAHMAWGQDSFSKPVIPASAGVTNEIKALIGF